MKKFAIIGAVLIIAIAAVGVFISQNKKDEDEGGPDQVKVVYAPFTGFTWVDIGIEEGYFAEQNIEVEKVYFNEPTDGILLLIQGELDVVPSAVNATLLNTLLQTDDVRIVGSQSYNGAEYCNVSGLFISAENADKFQTVADLKDASYAGSVGLGEYQMNVVLKTADLTINDMVFNPIAPPARIEAVASGAVDVVHLTEPFRTRALADDRLVEFAALNDFIEETEYATLVYGPNMFEDEDLGRRFMVAALKSLRQFGEGQTDRNLAIVSTALDQDPEFLRQTCWIQTHYDGKINLVSTQDFADFVFDQGLIDERVTVADYFDPRFVDYANEILATDPPVATDAP